MKEITVKINKTKSWLVAYLWQDKIDKPLARVIKRKREKNQINKIRNEKGEATTDGAEIHRIMRPLEWSEDAQSCPTLCNSMDCSLPGSSVHGIFQAIVLEWIAISFSRGSSWPRDQTWVSRIVDRCFTVWATREETIMNNYMAIK